MTRRTAATTSSAVLSLGLAAIAALAGGCTKDAPKREAPPASAEPEPAALGEPLAVHMHDHMSIATQARDALIRGRFEDATGALTWLAQHREPSTELARTPELASVQKAAQRALDTSDLGEAGRAIGALAASCGQCHRDRGVRPSLEPSGYEQLDEVTLETHMHGYLWATETLWQALVLDPELWPTGLTALAELEPPAQAKPLTPVFTAIRVWAEGARNAKTPSERGEAYGRLVAVCGGCHQARGVSP